jgi:hypothetical protein
MNAAQDKKRHVKHLNQQAKEDDKIDNTIANLFLRTIMLYVCVCMRYIHVCYTNKRIVWGHNILMQ